MNQLRVCSTRDENWLCKHGSMLTKFVAKKEKKEPKFASRCQMCEDHGLYVLHYSPVQTYGVLLV